jgi:4-aminobutyrate aminotransferase-like enzyme
MSQIAPAPPATVALACGDFVYRSSPVPVFVASDGAYLIDGDGRRWLDAEAANGSAGLGYDRSILHDALRRLGTMPGAPSFCETDIRLHVADRLERLCREATGQPGRVAFELGGAQGVELACKVIRCNTARSYFAVLEGGYHGRSGITSLLSSGERYRTLTRDARLPVVRLPYPDCQQCRFGQARATCRLECVSYVETLTTAEVAGLARAGEIDVAALVVEPILNAGGMVRPDRAYLDAVVNAFRARGALIVADETFTGLWRTGRPFGFQHFGFVPDLIVFSKSLANGATPFSCVWGAEPLMAPAVFAPGTHSATFINNPLALAVVDAVLDRYAAWPDLPAALGRLQAALESIIREVVGCSPLAASGYALGGLGRILLRRPVAARLSEVGRSVALADPVSGVHGVILASTGMARNVVAVHPPLNISTDDLGCLRELILRTFRRVEKEQS